ncbi:MAG TPA: polysaccharide biosynthesis tyrosine autokinase [Oscillatoriaceae cyanobacterium]
MELKRYWQILWKRRVSAEVMLALALGGAALVTQLMPPTYQSSTKLLLEHQDKTLASINDRLGDLSQLSALTLTSSPLETQAEVIKSAPVVEAVIARLKLHDRQGNPLTVDAFLKHGRVTVMKDTDVLQVSYRAHDAGTAQQTASVWTQMYLETNREAHRVQASSAVRFIAERLQQTKDELNKSETALQNFKRTHGAIDLDTESKASVQSLSDLEAQYRDASASYDASRARLNALQHRVGMGPAHAMAAAAISQDPDIQHLRQQLLDAETAPALTDPTLGAANPEVQQARAHVQALRRQLARQAEALVGKSYSGVEAPMDPVREDLTRTMVQAEVDALGDRNRVEALHRLIGTFNGKLSHLPAQQLVLTRLTRNADADSKLYEMLRQRYEEACIEQAEQLGNVRMIENAGLPGKPVAPILPLNLAIGLVLGLVLGGGLVLLQEQLDDTIQSVEDLEDALKLPVLGIVPWIRSNAAHRLVMVAAPQTPAAEAYRSLRTNLRFQCAEALRALAVSSVAPGEGKSTTVANLAVAFAQTGKRVLVVDADMRNPNVHRLFGLDNGQGLSNVLQGSLGVQDAIQAVSEYLAVLPAGPTPVNPSELLDSSAVARRVDALETRYDMVLYDTPPLLPVTDAALLATKLQGVLLVAGVNRATAKALRHAHKSLRAARVSVLATLLSGLRPEQDGYYQKFYNRYYDQKKPRKSNGKAATLALSAEWARPRGDMPSAGG